MAKLLFSEQFLDDASTIYSERIKERLRAVLLTLERFPESGSKALPVSIRMEFGDGVRKYAFGPFDLIYEFDEAEQVVTVQGLVSQKMAF